MPAQEEENPDTQDDARLNPLIAAAEAIERSRALARGYLKKQSTKQGKSIWQRRFFMILPGQHGSYYLAYSKQDAPGSPILASMDLSQAGGVYQLEGLGGCHFALKWDKLREFQCSTADECAMWVGTIRRVQSEGRRGAKEWGEPGSRAAAEKRATGGCCTLQ